MLLSAGPPLSPKRLSEIRVGIPMTTYLLTWNPKNWHWAELARTVARVRAGRLIPDQWSCARSHRIRKGDRLFIMKQGKEPRGIFGSGWATSNAFEDGHWSDSSSSPFSMYVQLKWDALLDPENEPILPRDVLNRGRLSRMFWDAQSSGNHISDEVAAELERVWAGFLESKIGITLVNSKTPNATLLRGHGAGFGIYDNNVLVERAAVDLVRKKYLRDGWSVKSVEHDRCGYDLRCRKGRSLQEVEVKGIAGTNEVFTLTAGEVAQANRNPKFMICVVIGATSRHATMHSYSGEEFLQQFVLDPIQYRATFRG
jgi:hypothetical protein